MNTQRIGRCSECGGDVMAHSGAWLGTIPPPPPTCASCGAVEAAADPVIPMRPRRYGDRDSTTFGGVQLTVFRMARAADWWPNGLPANLQVTP